jgi:AcrR family transcriptional regulator
MQEEEPLSANGTDGTFQRARSPEQRQQRRRAILLAASELLDEAPVAEISLRSISRRTGCATSNVLHYFESREAVFLELLDEAWGEWICSLATVLPRQDAPVEALAEAFAASLAVRPRLCELLSALGALLGDNRSAGALALFRDRAAARNLEVARILAARPLGLTLAAASEAVAMASAFVAGWWPLAYPQSPLPEVPRVREPDLVPQLDFQEGLTRALTVMIRGISATSEAGD